MKSKRALGQQLLALLPIFVNGTVSGCVMSWLPNAVFFMTQPNYQPSATVVQCGWMESWFQIGKLVFAMPGGILVDKIGTKYVVILVGSSNFLSWLALSMYRSIPLIYVVRFLQGVAAALFNTASLNVIGEIAQPHLRSMFIGFFRVAVAFGILVQGLCSVMFTSYSILAYVATAMALLFFPAICWLVETPNHLLRIGRKDEAKRVLFQLRRGSPEDEVRKEYESLAESIKLETTERAVGWFRFLTSPPVRRPITAAIVLNLLVLANGSTVIQLYAAVIFPPNDFFSSNYYPLMLATIQLFSAMGSTLVLEVFSRRGLYMFAIMLTFFLQSFNGLAYYQYAHSIGSPAAWKWCFLAGNAAYWMLNYTLIVPLNNTVRSEIFPHSISGFGNAICLICQSASAIWGYYIHNLLNKYCGLWASYWVYASNAALLVVCVYFLLPETRGKSLADVQKANRIDAGANKKNLVVKQQKTRY